MIVLEVLFALSCGIVVAVGVARLPTLLGRFLVSVLSDKTRPILQASFTRLGEGEVAFHKMLGTAAGLILLIPLLAIVDGNLLVLPLLGLLGLIVVHLDRLRQSRQNVNRDLESLTVEMALAVSAGRDMWGALELVVKHRTGTFARHLNESLGSVRLGQPRDAALDQIQENFPESRSLFSTLLMAERQGTSLSDTLRELSLRSRRERLWRAEARAQRLPVLLLGPLTLCIFPTVFIVLLGPFLLELL